MPQSFRIMKIEEFDDSIYYRAACSCGSKDHDVTIEIEIDKKLPGMVFMNFYKNVAWCSHWGDHQTYRAKFWKRIKASLKMLFTGYIELEESFILQGEEQINEFIQALEEGHKYAKTR